jgi:hypothetical protein
MQPSRPGPTDSVTEARHGGMGIGASGSAPAQPPSVRRKILIGTTAAVTALLAGVPVIVWAAGSDLPRPMLIGSKRPFALERAVHPPQPGAGIGRSSGPTTATAAGPPSPTPSSVGSGPPDRLKQASIGRGTTSDSTGSGPPMSGTAADGPTRTQPSGRPPVSAAPGAQPPPAPVPPAAQPPVPPAPPCGVSSGSRTFDARTNYAASTGTISWGDHWLVVSGKLVDTQNYVSTSSTYLHWETNPGSSCGSWGVHETQLATAADGTTQTLNRTVNYGTGAYIRNVLIRTCTQRGGFSCSDWK